MLNNSTPYAIDFFQFFMENILPYEVKHSTIIKKKSFDLHKNIIEKILLKFNKDLNDEKFASILFELEEIAYIVQDNYLEALYELFEQKLSTDTLLKISQYIETDDFLKAIILIEDELNIKHISNDRVISDIDPHISDNIYKLDYEKLHAVLDDFRDAFFYFNKDIVSKINPNKEIEGRVSEEEYLVYVVYNEAWNFLSHMSYAIAYFDSPRFYISNIEKGVSHLRRAILDIYDGLIVDTQGINEEYLSIRSTKLSSLGNTAKIESLSKSLRDHYIKYNK